MEDPPPILVRFRNHILVSLLLTLATGTLLLLSKSQFLSPYKVEVITANPTASASASLAPNKKLIIDLTGEVVNPSVYELEAGSRIGDALDAAGGLTTNADANWVAKNINRAAPLTDGQKIYVPSKTEQKEVLSVVSSSNVQVSSVVNINTASQKDLESLWGIGPATAQKLIEQRPYSSVEELLSKKILKKNVYDKISKELSVY